MEFVLLFLLYLTYYEDIEISRAPLSITIYNL